MKSGNGIRNAVMIALCVVLAALLAAMMYLSEQSEKKRQATAEELQAQAKQYEEELAQIKSDLNERAKNISYTSDTAEAMIGFVLSQAEDIDTVKSFAEKFDLKPVLIVDCKNGLSEAKNLVDAANATGWEIMLGASSFSEKVNSDVVEILSYMDSIGAENTGVFLIRNDSFTNKNVQMLIDDGFIGYTKYNQTSPAAGVTEEGYVYFDYSYLQSMQTSVADRLYALCSNKAALLVAFEMNAMHSGDVTEEYAETLLQLLKDYESEGKCSIKSAENVVSALLSVNKTEEERRADYEEYEASQQEKIEELEKKIREIYNQTQ